MYCQPGIRTCCTPSRTCSFLPHHPQSRIMQPQNLCWAEGRCLRESRDPSGPRLPPFRHDSRSRDIFLRLNVFLVIINAEITFRRYFRILAPSTPLPADALDPMRRNMELVKLFYWNSPGHTW